MNYLIKSFFSIRQFICEKLFPFISSLVAAICMLILLSLFIGPSVMVFLKTVYPESCTCALIKAYHGDLISDWTASVSVIAVCITAVCAYLAYQESLKSRRQNAFSDMFTQLLVMQKDIFTKKTLVTTDFIIGKQPQNAIQQKNIFWNFVEYYKVESEDKKLSLQQICDIWVGFYGIICEKSDFSQCFKYIYHEIDTILKNQDIFQNKEAKDYYVKLIQATMNKDELFCYFINLLDFFHKHDFNDNRRKHIELLQEAEFFSDICRLNDKDEYCKLMVGIKSALNPGNQLESMFRDMIVTNA